MLNSIPDSFDKRQGSIIYDALVPCAIELAQLNMDMEIKKEQSYLTTATGINLDNKGADFAINRNLGTYAYRIAEAKNNDILIDIPLNTRYSSVDTLNEITFIVTEKISTGKFILKCEQLGNIGNEYFGELLPLQTVNDLTTIKIISTHINGINEENDDDYRKRIIDSLTQKPFSGNIADYIQFTKNITGVGDLKVFPVWDGGGTVLLSVIDNIYNPITDELKNKIKNIIDPKKNTGLGIGIAPIGHKVTITTPILTTINVSAKLTLNNVTIGQVENKIRTNIEEYFYSIRKNWSSSEITNIFIAKINEAIIKIDGIINVYDIKLNNLTNDVILIDTALLQYLPIKGDITLE